MTLRAVPSVLGKRACREVYLNSSRQPLHAFCRPFTASATSSYATVQEEHPKRNQSSSSASSPSSTNSSSRQASSNSSTSSSQASTSQSSASTKQPSIDGSTKSTSESLDSHDWEHNPNLSISKFSELPGSNFGVNQHIVINEEFKEALRQILWQFRAPIRYAFAYGSGVFPQTSGTTSSSSTLHPNPPKGIDNVQKGGQKMIDFIFGVSYSQHWHSLNLQEHRNHYSMLGSLGSYAVSRIQDGIGAGVYFNPYVTVNGTLIKYGVVNIDTLCRDLSEWDTMYLAGRLHKPVKVLRDNPSVRLANQVNLISAVRTALLLLPDEFTEEDLYSTIAGISYMGDPRMSIGGDDPRKVDNIVKHQLPHFRRLYAPLIDNLPNIAFNDPVTTDESWFGDPKINAKLNQDMNPLTRGHMVRRLPKAFRQKLYFEYQAKFKIPRGEFNKMMEETADEDPDRIRRREGGPFEQRIAKDVEGGGLREEVRQVISKTIRWPASTQSIKSIFTAGMGRSWRYASEKRQKAKAGAAKKSEESDSISKSKDEKVEKIKAETKKDE